MRKLQTIQENNNLNEVYAMDEADIGGACHKYIIQSITNENQGGFMTCINYQHGARKDPNAIYGVLDEDLLEMVRDRLTGFQQGDFSCKENSDALYHVTEALKCMNRRKIDRANRDVLGTYRK